MGMDGVGDMCVDHGQDPLPTSGAKLGSAWNYAGTFEEVRSRMVAVEGWAKWGCMCLNRKGGWGDDYGGWASWFVCV
jgi:hypothetical protein